jgi:hypothetical protein
VADHIKKLAAAINDIPARSMMSWFWSWRDPADLFCPPDSQISP